MTNRTEWLAERRSGIGGSDVAAILGISPWRTPVDVWLDKRGELPEEEPSDAMRIGTELEDLVARRYAETEEREVVRHNKMLHEGCLLANVDRLVIPAGAKVAAHMGVIRTDRILECKTSSHDWTDGVPLYYQTQVQHYMGLIPSVEVCDVACLFLVHKHFEVHHIERDNEVIAALQARCREWWQKHIVNGEVPPPTSEADCKALWARSNPGKTITADDAAIALLAEYKAASAAVDAAEKTLAEQKTRLLTILGDAEILADATGKPLVTYKSAKDSSRTDWKAVCNAVTIPAEVIAANTKVTAGSRRLIVK